MSLSDEDKEALNEMLDSEGWRILWTVIMPDHLKKAAAGVFTCVRAYETSAAAAQVGKYDGAVHVADAAYLAAGIDRKEIPKHITELRRPD